MGRTKGSKNKPKVDPKSYKSFPKVAHVNDVKISLPTDVDKYEVKRAYWFLLAIEKRIMVDPSAISPAKYFEALKMYTDLVRAYKAKGKNAKKGMDAKSAQGGSTEPGGSAGTGKDGSPDLGARIRTDNPIT